MGKSQSLHRKFRWEFNSHRYNFDGNSIPISRIPIDAILIGNRFPSMQFRWELNSHQKISHPDKPKNDSTITAKFQDINETYKDKHQTGLKRPSLYIFNSLNDP